MLVEAGFGVGGAYDLSGGCVAVEVEDLCEFGLGGCVFGEHAPGFGAAAGRGIDQDGFFDSGEGGEEFAHRQVVAAAVGGLPRVFRTAVFASIYAARCEFR